MYESWFLHNLASIWVLLLRRKTTEDLCQFDSWKWYRRSYCCFNVRFFKLAPKRLNFVFFVSVSCVCVEDSIHILHLFFCKATVYFSYWFEDLSIESLDYIFIICCKYFSPIYHFPFNIYGVLWHLTFNIAKSMNLFLYGFFPQCIIDKTGEILGKASLLFPASCFRNKWYCSHFRLV